MNPQLDQIAHILTLLAHATRLRILRLLVQGEPLTVSTMLIPLAMKHAALTHHVIRLEKVGLLVSVRKGRNVYYSISDPVLVGTLIGSLTRLSTLDGVNSSVFAYRTVVV